MISSVIPCVPHRILVSSLYLPPVSWFAHLYASTGATEDRGEHFVKQTYRNRCHIATPQGVQALTVPVERNGAGHTAMRDVRLSEHGNWRHQHWTALVSAYENSPYFEYYADDFDRIYQKPFRYLADWNEALIHTVLSLLSLEREIEVSERYIEHVGADVVDLRSVISPKEKEIQVPQFAPRPYYQVFGERTGFLADLSIVDLLFNMGNESRIVLRDSLMTENLHL